MIISIKNTLRRLFAKISVFNPILWFPLLIEGIAIEFNRVREFKDSVYSSTVANTNMDPDSIVDYNDKYGIPQTLTGTDSEKIARIIEKSNLNGYPGPEWLQEQIQLAGYELYVIENKPQSQNLNQWGSGIQWGSDGVNWGLTSRFINPDLIFGELCVSSPYTGAGRLYLNQFGSTIFGDGSQFGTLDPNALNPQPFIYRRLDNSGYWGFYFTLSPFADRVAVDETEFLEMTQQEFDYLCKLVIQLKMIRNWCIVQAKVS